MTLLRLALATWRICSLLRDEDGPLLVFERMRRALGPGEVAIEGYSAPAPGWRGEVARAIECHWCLSVWVGWLVAIVDARAPLATSGLAASAGYLLAEQVWAPVGSWAWHVHKPEPASPSTSLPD